VKTYRVGFSEATGRAPRFIEPESLQVIDGGRKVYFRDSIGVTVAVYSEGAGIVSIEPVEDPKGWYIYPTKFPGDLDLAEKIRPSSLISGDNVKAYIESPSKSYGLYINPET